MEPTEIEEIVSFKQFISFTKTLRHLKFNRWDIYDVITRIQRMKNFISIADIEEKKFHVRDEKCLIDFLLSFLESSLAYLANQLKGELLSFEKDKLEFLSSPSFENKLNQLEKLFKEEDSYFVFYLTTLSFILFEREYYAYVSSFNLISLEKDNEIRILKEDNEISIQTISFIKALLKNADTLLLEHLKIVLSDIKDDDSILKAEDGITNEIAEERAIQIMSQPIFVFESKKKNIIHNGFNLFDGNIVINWTSVSSKNQRIALARFVVIYIHELAHSIRYRFAIKGKLMKSTPIKLKKEAGCYLEKQVFGFAISENVACIDERIANMILKENNYIFKGFLKKDRYAYQRYYGYDGFETTRACIHQPSRKRWRCRLN